MTRPPHFPVVQVQWGGPEMRGGVVLLLLLFPSILPAQSLPFGLGARVRVRTGNSESFVGTLGVVTSDYLVLRQPGREVRLSRGLIEEVQVSSGVTRFWMPGLLVGALGGMLAGFYVGGLGKDEQLDPSGIICSNDKQCGQLSGTIVGMFVGGLVGAVVGYNVKVDRWRPIPLTERVAATLDIPPRGGVRIGMRVAVGR